MHRANATGPARRSTRLAVLPLLLLAGCTTSQGEQTWWNPMGLATAPSNPPPAGNVVLPVRTADPVAAFAGRARIGQQESVALADSGGLVTARLARVYNAASGRECREVQFSAGAGAIYCNDPAAGWVAARPLLRGGAVARP